MKIRRDYCPADDKHIITIEFTGDYLCDCEKYPFAHLITEEQGLGIIEDAVLMASGLQLPRLGMDAIAVQNHAAAESEL